MQRVLNVLRGRSGRLAIAAGLVLSVFHSAPQASAETTIRVGGLSEATIVGLAKGWFKEEGLNVEVTEIANFMQYPTMLASGSIDVLDGYLPANLWNMIHSGADMRIIGGSSMAVAAHDGEPARNVRGYIVRKDLYDSGEVTKIADLAGRRLADFAPVPPKGSVSPFPVGHKVFGDVYKEIEWVRMKESDILNALATKTIDGGRMRTRWIKIAVNQGLAVELVKETDFVPRIQVSALVTTGEFLEKNRDALEAFLRVYLRGQEYVREVQKGMHEEEYVNAVKEHSSIPPEIALELLQELAYTDEVAVDDLQATQEHFVMVGAQEAVIPVEKVFDRSLLDAAKAK